MRRVNSKRHEVASSPPVTLCDCYYPDNIIMTAAGMIWGWAGIWMGVISAALPAPADRPVLVLLRLL